MHKIALLVCMSIFSYNALSAILPCDELKARVDAKLQSKGVPSYTLEIVTVEPNSTISNASGVSSASNNAGKQKINGKEVGTCEGGTKRLIYTRGN